MSPRFCCPKEPHDPFATLRATARPGGLGDPGSGFAGRGAGGGPGRGAGLCPPRLCRVSRRSEEHTSELQSLMRISYAVFCLKKKKKNTRTRKREDDTSDINDIRTIRRRNLVN